jgi:hypothetical protein
MRKLYLGVPALCLVFVFSLVFSQFQTGSASEDQHLRAGDRVISRAGGQGANIGAYISFVSRNFCPLLYADHFGNPASGWPIYDDGIISYQYLAGEYQILIRDPGWIAGARPGIKLEDFSASVDFHNVSGAYGSYGFVFGLADDWSELYTFEIERDGLFGIFKYDSNGWDLLAVDFSSAINTGTGLNHITLEREGFLITVYANGTQLASVSNGSFTGLRHLGLISNSYDEPYVDVRFDNLVATVNGCPVSAAMVEASQGILELRESGAGGTNLKRDWFREGGPGAQTMNNTIPRFMFEP